MSVLDLFTGAASKKAARLNQFAIQQGQQQSLGALGSGRDSALNLLGTGTGAPGSGGGDALEALGQGFGQARTDLNAANDRTQGYLGQVGGLYGDLTRTGLDASNARSDALGLNGADGLARAKTAFTGSLGYNAGLDEGLDAVMRTAAARGGLGGGNVSRDLFQYATDYQNRQAGDYIDRLGTVANGYTTGLAGQAAGLGAQAQASQGYGSALSALGTGRGTGEAGIYGLGANVQNGFGQNVSNVYQGGVQQQVGNNNAEAQARNAAGANVLGAVLGGAQLVSGNFGGAAGRAAGGSGGGANVSPYAGNPFLSAVSALGNVFA